MTESSDSQAQKPKDTPEYLKFVALLIVFLVVILAAAALSPRLVSEVTPSVLGLDGAPAALPAAEEAPTIEDAPVIEPEILVEPNSQAAPEQAAPVQSLDGMGGEPAGLQHEVQAGQTLYQLAALYGVSVQEIAAANNLVNPAQIEAGAILIIPQTE